MKKLAILATVLIGFSTLAQTTKGKIYYDVDITSDNPQVQAMLGQMEGSGLEITYDPTHIRSEFFMGSAMTTTTITGEGSDYSLTLLDGMMGKIAMKTSEADLTEEEKEQIEGREVELVEGSKEVMGYQCKKAIVTDSEGNETIIWYAPELLPGFRENTMFAMKEIPGLPLIFSFNQGPMKVSCIAYEYSKKVKKPEELFNMEVPDGYTIKTLEDMRKMQGRR